MKTASTPATAAAMSSPKVRRPALALSATRVVEAGLVDGNLPPFAQAGELGGVHLDHGHIVAQFGEAGT